MVRIPKKQSAIEKRQRIIEKGFELMCEKGYHNVNCIDIAKYSGVSTGIIYQYFNDKRDIFIAGVKNYSNNIMYPMFDILDNNISINESISNIIDKFIETHKMSYKSHEELMSMTHLDNDVKEIFSENEMNLTKKILTYLDKNNFKCNKERVHIIIGLVENYCHEVVYHNHKGMDYKKMKEDLIEVISYLLNKKK